MENTSLREYIRTVFTVVLFVLILFFGVHLLSWGDASIRESLPALPDDVYGYGEAEKAPQADALPTNPVLRVYAWEKDDAERRALISLALGEEIQSGPRIQWNDAYLWECADPNFGAAGLTLGFDGSGGIIRLRWEHGGKDCGGNHSVYYSGGGVDTVDITRMKVSTSAEAEGISRMCVLFRGEGGRAEDTVSASGRKLPDGIHTVETLADVTGLEPTSEHLRVTRDKMEILLHAECWTLLGELEARATVRITMTSGWRGAAERWAAVQADREADLKWLILSVAKPVWTVELVQYREY